MDVLLSGDVISYTISYLEDFRDVLALLQVSRTMRDQVLTYLTELRCSCKPRDAVDCPFERSALFPSFSEREQSNGDDLHHRRLVEDRRERDYNAEQAVCTDLFRHHAKNVRAYLKNKPRNHNNAPLSPTPNVTQTGEEALSEYKKYLFHDVESRSSQFSDKSKDCEFEERTKERAKNIQFLTDWSAKIWNCKSIRLCLHRYDWLQPLLSSIQDVNTLDAWVCPELFAPIAADCFAGKSIQELTLRLAASKQSRKTADVEMEDAQVSLFLQTILHATDSRLNSLTIDLRNNNIIPPPFKFENGAPIHQFHQWNETDRGISSVNICLEGALRGGLMTHLTHFSFRMNGPVVTGFGNKEGLDLYMILEHMPVLRRVELSAAKLNESTLPPRGFEHNYLQEMTLRLYDCPSSSFFCSILESTPLLSELVVHCHKMTRNPGIPQRAQEASPYYTIAHPSISRLSMSHFDANVLVVQCPELTELHVCDVRVTELDLPRSCSLQVLKLDACLQLNPGNLYAIAARFQDTLEFFSIDTSVVVDCGHLASLLNACTNLCIRSQNSFNSVSRSKIYDQASGVPAGITPNLSHAMLTSLRIQGIEFPMSFKSFSVNFCGALENLSISSLTNVERISIFQTPRLVNLSINSCPTLHVLELGEPTALSMDEIDFDTMEPKSGSTKRQENEAKEPEGVPPIETLVIQNCHTIHPQSFLVALRSLSATLDCLNLSTLKWFLSSDTERYKKPTPIVAAAPANPNVNPPRFPTLVVGMDAMPEGTLSPFSKPFNKLRFITLQHMSNVQPVFLDELMRASPSLYRVSLSYCDALREPQFYHPTMKELRMYYLRCIRASAIERAVAQSPCLSTISVSFCDSFPALHLKGTALQHVSILNCSHMLSEISIESPCLSRVRITGCKKAWSWNPDSKIWTPDWKITGPQSVYVDKGKFIPTQPPVSAQPAAARPAAGPLVVVNGAPAAKKPCCQLM